MSFVSQALWSTGENRRLQKRKSSHFDFMKTAKTLYNHPKNNYEMAGGFGSMDAMNKAIRQNRALSGGGHRPFDNDQPALMGKRNRKMTGRTPDERHPSAYHRGSDRYIGGLICAILIIMTLFFFVSFGTLT